MTQTASEQQVHDLWNQLNREGRERQQLALQQQETMGRVALLHQRLDTIETSMASHRTESRAALDQIRADQAASADRITKSIDTLQLSVHALDKEHATNRGAKLQTREIVGWLLAVASILIAAFALVN